MFRELGGAPGQPPPLRWEAVNYRGQDITIADMEVIGLGGRKLYFGEGPVVQSPADIDRMLVRRPSPSFLFSNI
jgi:hypothetical protein